MLEVNDFNAIHISLASPEQVLDWSFGEVTKPETINYRTLKPERDGLFCERIFGPTKDWECYCGKYKRVRYKGIICERCGVEVTRQKVRRERMGHIDLAAPVSHIWFFKGVPSRIGYLLDIAPRELEKVLYFAASIVTAVDVAARKKDLNDLEDKVKAEAERIEVDREEALAALEDRLKRRRDYFAKGKDKGFDEDDDFWARGLSNWAEEQAMPPLEEARDLAGKMFPDLVGQITTEDSKKIRELVRNAAIRDDRKLTPRELENVASAAEQILNGLETLFKQQAKATGAKKGAISKHINRILDALLDGDEIAEEDAKFVEGVDMKNLDRSRELGNGLLADVVDTWDGEQDIRELTNDLCLRTDGKIQKEDLDAIVQWSLKVREMYLDMESRREDAREAAVDSVRRLEQTWQLFKDLEPKLIVNDEQLFRELKDRFGSPFGFGVYFRGGMGAESIRELLRDLDLDAEASMLRETIRTSKGQKQQRAIKRLKVVNAFIKSENKPDWMVLEAIPVIPPELRPMVQLDGGRFATSDLNDLYRRVINRNNRLKRLLDLGAPEIIVNNEKRMLQEAVDALFDNGRRGRSVTGPGNRPLKSLSDMLKGKAIQVHPLVCHAFNADFDGDQMAVHLPLSAEAQAEARILMLSSNNILSPASGRPLATPTKDMVLGTYYLTYCGTDLDKTKLEDIEPRPKRFASEEEVEHAIDAEQVTLQQPIEFRWNGDLLLTTPGRVIFNSEVERALAEAVEDYNPEDPLHDYINRTLPKRELDAFIAELVHEYGAHSIASVLDMIKTLGFKYATQAGVTISKNDIVIPPDKETILAEYEERVSKVEAQYERGLITDEERHESIVNIWTEATDTVADAMERTFFELNPIYMMANSGARGSSNQIRPLAGMRGLMANPKGEIIERPIKANFMEGLSVLEYFISTHGARKGLADTALRTADSGYLTRRLVDVSQDVIIREDDCKTKEFIELPLFLPDGLNKSVAGRIVAEDVHKPLASGKPGKTVVASKGEEITMPRLREVAEELGDEVGEGF